MATVPSVSEEPAGVIQTSAGLNALSSAAQWMISPPASGGKPRFVLYNEGPNIGTSYAAFPWTLTADSDNGFSAGTPNRYTVKTAGYWSIDWTIVFAGTGLLNAYAQVVTSASNEFNPSVTLPFQWTGVGNPGTDHPMATSGGLIPVYLFPGDYIQIMATAASTATSGPCFFTGMWVSA